MEIRIPFLRWMESASARALFDPQKGGDGKSAGCGWKILQDRIAAWFLAETFEIVAVAKRNLDGCLERYEEKAWKQNQELP